MKKKYSNQKNTFIQIMCVLILISLFVGCIDNIDDRNNKPSVFIHHPQEMDTILGIVNITGSAYDPDGSESIKHIEIQIQNNTWKKAEGTVNWSYTWRSYTTEDGVITLSVKAWDGYHYSPVKQRQVVLSNPLDVNHGTHKWAIYIAAANFPENELNKLGNGGLYLAQNMSSYFIEELSYSTSHITILFDDGWIRNNSGFGSPTKQLKKIPHPYNISYGAATKQQVIQTLNQVIKDANQYDDSEIFLWIFNHGFGDYTNKVTGGKLFEESIIFLWDGYLIDSELGTLLAPLQSKKTCIIVDACYIGGFADRTIFNLPTLPFLQSDVPQNGRVVITSTSKFRTGIAIVEYGPLFSLLWFDGLITGQADGFRPGVLKTGRQPTIMVKDDLVSAEEAFYYARYLLRTVDGLDQFRSMQPQINDQYPVKGLIRSMKGLHLGER